MNNYDLSWRPEIAQTGSGAMPKTSSLQGPTPSGPIRPGGNEAGLGGDVPVPKKRCTIPTSTAARGTLL